MNRDVCGEIETKAVYMLRSFRKISWHSGSNSKYALEFSCYFWCTYIFKENMKFDFVKRMGANAFFPVS